jgi:hypothetical protein
VQFASFQFINLPISVRAFVNNLITTVTVRLRRLLGVKIPGSSIPQDSCGEKSEHPRAVRQLFSHIKSQSLRQKKENFSHRQDHLEVKGVMISPKYEFNTAENDEESH